MTTPSDPDDLASALLDGLLDEDEATAARRDPAVVSRWVELAVAREAMATPPSGADPAARERAVAAALAAYDAGDERQDTEVPVGTAVTPMVRGRRAARPATSGMATPGRALGGARHRWLVASIVLAVVGLGVFVRYVDTGGDEGDTAAREAVTDESSNAGGGTGGATEDAEAGGEGTAATREAAGIVDLGEVDSSEALTDRARSILAERFASPLAGASGGDATDEQGAGGDLGVPPATCDDDAAAERITSASEPVVLRARATLDGKAVDVWVLGAQDEERVVAIDASCAVVVDQPLQR